MSTSEPQQTAESVAPCTCERGCRNCGMAEAQMGACPAWDPCPLGREDNPDCPLHHPVAKSPPQQVHVTITAHEPRPNPHPCEVGRHRWAWLVDGRQACGYCGRLR